MSIAQAERRVVTLADESLPVYDVSDAVAVVVDADLGCQLAGAATNRPDRGRAAQAAGRIARSPARAAGPRRTDPASQAAVGARRANDPARHRERFRWARVAGRYWASARGKRSRSAWSASSGDRLSPRDKPEAEMLPVGRVLSSRSVVRDEGRASPRPSRRAERRSRSIGPTDGGRRLGGQSEPDTAYCRSCAGEVVSGDGRWLDRSPLDTQGNRGCFNSCQSLESAACARVA
jgi:hypothetical protein